MSSSNVRKNALGSRTDVGWEHGIEVEGKKKVKCKFCDKVVSGGIYRFKHHLACTKKDTEACKNVPDDVKKQMLMVVAKMELNKEKKTFSQVNIDDLEEEDEVELNLKKRKGKGIENYLSRSSVMSCKSQPKLNEFFKKELREEVSQAVARFFYTSAIPFNCVKNPNFGKMLELVGKYGQGYKPPSYHEIREKYLKQEVIRTTNRLDEYKAEWKRTGCSIMSDGWTDKRRRSICNFLVNSPKGTVFLSSVDTSDISKTTDKVFEMLDNIVEQVGEDNVVQIITDNAVNYKAAGEKLMQKRKKLFWTPCAVHCIDLILEDFEKKMPLHNETIAKGRKITTYIYGRTLLISMMKKFTKGRDLIRPGATRFATAYLTLGCLKEQRTNLQTMFNSRMWLTSKFASKEEGKEIQHLVLDHTYWKNVFICLGAALPLIKVLRLVDSEEKPAMGFIYDEMDRAKEHIQSNFNNVKKMYEPIWNIIDERWEAQLHRPLHATAYFLNPYYHYDADFKADAEVKQGLYICMGRMVQDRETRNKIDLQLQNFKRAVGLFGIESAKDLRKLKSPDEWWDSYGDDCPELQKFAIRILSLTCSSSGCERNWSAFEMVHTKRRNRLHQQKMNDLVFVMYNLKLMEGQTSRKVKDDLDFISSDDEWITENEVFGDGSSSSVFYGGNEGEGDEDIDLQDDDDVENNENLDDLTLGSYKLDNIYEHLDNSDDAMDVVGHGDDN